MKALECKHYNSKTMQCKEYIVDCRLTGGYKYCAGFIKKKSKRSII